MNIAIRYYTKTGNTKRLAEAVGIAVDEREFHCKGEFKGIHKGRPNDEDLDAVKKFAKSIVE
ncbi:MAG: hypothetical protein IK088_00075 [Lachnospiraceae bacterium]|nr:hypothetical protein [Lachnospiraceae bacterium]